MFEIGKELTNCDVFFSDEECGSFFDRLNYFSLVVLETALD